MYSYIHVHAQSCLNSNYTIMYMYIIIMTMYSTDVYCACTVHVGIYNGQTQLHFRQKPHP